jgi:hypothetical protein
MTTPHPDHAAIDQVIAAMEHYDRTWQRVLADLKGLDGDVEQSRQGEYEHAKDDHAWPVLESLPEWIAALKAATAPEAAPGARV